MVCRLLELPSLDAAWEWAARCPAASYGTWKCGQYPSKWSHASSYFRKDHPKKSIISLSLSFSCKISFLGGSFANVALL